MCDIRERTQEALAKVYSTGIAIELTKQVVSYDVHNVASIFEDESNKPSDYLRGAFEWSTKLPPIVWGTSWEKVWEKLKVAEAKQQSV